MNDDTVLVGLAAAPVITALVQMLKPWLPERTWPLAALAFGVLWNVGFTVGTEEFGRATVFLGIATGLAAAGLYSAQRAVRETLNGGKEEQP